MSIEDTIKEAEEQIKSECNKFRAMGFQVEEHEDYSLITKNGAVIRIDWEGIHVLKGNKND